jgi:N-acetyl-1-D-myo-inositol-2-amino-2-deoxy-alpha-D-glucopyranoside deacetylase
VSSVVDPLHDPEPAGQARLGIGALLVSVVFAFAVSLVAGVVTGFVHGQLAPWGLLGGMVVAAALILGFRLVFESRAAAVAAGAGILAGGILLAAPGAGPAPVRLDGADAGLGWVWLLWPVAVVLVVLLVSRRRGRTQERRTARP